jgi:chloramphenicol 3-O-phosphotransferase
MMNLNPTILETVIQTAFDAATERGGKDARRWQTAIAKAKQQLETNPYMHFDGDALLILSPESNEIYRANGSCQCKAWEKGKYPCVHRAAARIVKRYYEQTSH